MLLKYKYVFLFAWVLAEQVGLPLPSAPVLMAADTATELPGTRHAPL